MRRIVTTCAVALTLAFASPALADPVTTSSELVPMSSLGGSYLMSSPDGRLVAFQTADGRVRWELDGLPWSDWGVNDAVRAATVGFDDASVLVLGGAIRGVFVMGSADASWLAFQMPDGSVRWEHDGVPVQRQ
ncbi:MAG: hypothetical protein E6I40_03160 [Chloroflexi bacterium]|nr:MAG: hypothetical protein E6I40_03160 [Chloroflexota bacterium]TMF66558.1 MAG: hypothetical protein E6I20_03745 [Chloroflexota bacterium]TMG39529.1 MAG: hypothetical protein E6H94_05355 [Chloroflexota bacterium]TMG39745.1 MAG: hypothetical protein E6H88_01210 [Chloroflexota bacterium]